MSDCALTAIPQDRRGQRGFSLTELLVTMAMAGLLASGMFTLYLNMQRTTYNQSDIVDTQQSLRVAMDAISRDVRMAGFIITTETPGIAAASTATSLVINTASSSYALARLDGDVPVAGGTTTNVVFTVARPEMVDPFAVGNRVRIIRPNDGSQPLDNDLTVQVIARGDPNESPPVPTQLTLSGFTNTSLLNYKSGDMITLVADGGPDPETITWDLNAGNLGRTTNNGTAAAVASVVATNVDDLQFAYLAADGSTFASFPIADTDRANIVAIRVTITAAATNQMDQVDRQREMTSVIRLKNL